MAWGSMVMCSSPCGIRRSCYTGARQNCRCSVEVCGDGEGSNLEGAAVSRTCRARYLPAPNASAPVRGRSAFRRPRRRRELGSQLRACPGRREKHWGKCGTGRGRYRALRLGNTCPGGSVCRHRSTCKQPRYSKCSAFTLMLLRAAPNATRRYFVRILNHASRLTRFRL